MSIKGMAEIPPPVLALTLKLLLALSPLKDAVIVANPSATPVAKPGFACPVVSTIALLMLDEAHAAELVTSCVEPSL